MSNEKLKPEVVLANFVTMALDDWQMVDEGRAAALCDALTPVVAEHLKPILSAAEARGYARAREQAARVVEMAPASFNRNDHAERIRDMKDGE